MRIDYPIGTPIVIHPAFPRSDFSVEAAGKVVAHGSQGITVDVHNVDRGKDETRVLKPGHDRFVVRVDHGISLTEFLSTK